MTEVRELLFIYSFHLRTIWQTARPSSRRVLGPGELANTTVCGRGTQILLALYLALLHVLAQRRCWGLSLPRIIIHTFVHVSSLITYASVWW